MHSTTYAFVLHDFYSLCIFSVGCSLVCNFLPNDDVFRGHPRARLAYLYFIDVIACFALRIRAEQPSLDKEFMGFRRKLRHGWRNYRQAQMYKEYIEDTTTNR